MIGKVISPMARTVICRHRAHAQWPWTKSSSNGIKTNVPLHKEIFQHAAFRAGGTDIHYLERRLGLK
jgi:acetyl-CoA carboxylase, biotin carboxylase subunit